MTNNAERTSNDPLFSDRKNEENNRAARRRTLAEMARSACDKFGGCAQIDEHYCFVDTRKFTISQK